MRAAWIVVGMLIAAMLVAMMGCRFGTRTPTREQTRPYDLVPQSGYLADGPTVSPDYAAPPASEDDDSGTNEAAYRAAIQKDLVRINVLLTENERLRQELAATKLMLDEARDEIEKLRKAITTLEAKLERVKARAKRRGGNVPGEE